MSVRARIRRLLQPRWELGTIVYEESGHWTLSEITNDGWGEPIEPVRVWIASTNSALSMPERQMDTYAHRFGTGWRRPAK